MAVIAEVKRSSPSKGALAAIQGRLTAAILADPRNTEHYQAFDAAGRLDQAAAMYAVGKVADIKPGAYIGSGATPRGGRSPGSSAATSTPSATAWRSCSASSGCTSRVRR